MTRCAVAVCLLVLTLSVLLHLAAANFKKPPFNGSIFGKRGNPGDFESASKALSSMCEIASEACAAWFPLMENK